MMKETDVPDVNVLGRWRKTEQAWLSGVRHRLATFQDTFQKHADLCEHCYALIVWSLGTPKPEKCRRCDHQL